MICSFSTDVAAWVCNAVCLGTSALVVGLLPTLSAAEEKFGRVNFEYGDPVASECESGTEGPLKVSLKNIGARLKTLEAVTYEPAECTTKERRGTEIIETTIPCNENEIPPAPESPTVNARIDGMLEGCQRGKFVRLISGTLTFSVIPSDISWDIQVSAEPESDYHLTSLARFLESLMPRRKYIPIKGETRPRFDRVPKKVFEIIGDFYHQNAATLPTDEQYVTIIDTEISVTYGSSTDKPNGVNQ